METGPLKRQFKLNEVIWVGPSYKKKKFGNTVRDSHHVHAQRKGHMRT